MTVRLATLAWLLVVWLVMFRSFTPGAVAGGLAVSILLMIVFQPQRMPREPFSIRPLSLAAFMGFFIRKLMQANIQVAWAVIKPDRTRLRRAIVAVPIITASDTIITLLANAISLTPGTFIVEMRRDPSTFYVHVLQLTSVEEVRLDVLDLERRLVKAIGPTDTLEEIHRRIDALLATTNQPEATE